MVVADVSPPEILALVGDPHRWQLLSELAASDRRVGELTELLGKPQNVVSYHLAALRAAGVVSARRSSADGRDVYYRADLARCGELLAGACGQLHPSLRFEPPSTSAAPRARAARSPRVLFLCTGNSARSQIAEALLVHRSGGAMEARSAGSEPKVLHPLAVQVMAERGIDISGNATKSLRRFTRMRFDRVITLCDKVREVCPDFDGAEGTAHWSIPDPATDADPDAIRLVADDLEARIDLLIAELTARPAEEADRA